MHRYEKINLMKCERLDELPSIKHAYATLDCPQCHWRTPIPPEYTDWRAVAETYEKAYKTMGAQFFQKLEEAAKTFDVPLVEYFDADRQIMLAQLRDILDQLKNRDANP